MTKLNYIYYLTTLSKQYSKLIYIYIYIKDDFTIKICLFNDSGVLSFSGGITVKVAIAAIDNTSPK